MQVNNTCPLAAKDYFFKNGFIAFIARLIGNVIPIDRTGADKTGLSLCASKQKEGKNIVMFPEGTRTSTREIGTFKKGAVMLSREVKTPIIPTYIQGTLESLPKTSYFPRRAKIAVIFGKPVCYWQNSFENISHLEAAYHLEGQVRELQATIENMENK